MRSLLVHSLLVGAGGFAGAILRYGTNVFVLRHFPASTFPWATFSVNLAGCLLIGVAAGLAESRQLASTELRVFVMVGLLGGFTTFSAFGFETFALLRNEEFLRAAVSVGVQVVAGVLLVWVGYALAKP
jgi:fluoride exporter